MSEYVVHARSSGVFGRVNVQVRDKALTVDGPVENGCPGEEITPSEAFLGGVASCAVELLEVLARSKEVPLRGVRARIHGVLDRDHPVRQDVTVFNEVELSLILEGVDASRAEGLVEAFKGR